MNLFYLKFNSSRILVLVLLISLKGFSQKTPSWFSGEELFTDSDLKLKIYMKIDPASCDQNTNSVSKYKFKVLEKSTNSQSRYITFSFDYVDCNDEIITKIISVDIFDTNEGEEITSLDFEFSAKKFSIDPITKLYFYNVKRSDNAFQETKSKYPKPPKSISGNNQIMLGASTILQVNGDQLLDGTKWVWLKDSCNGTKLISGITNTISVKPTETTSYFVKAIEDKTGYITSCVSIIVYVDNKSKEADEIIGNDHVCAEKPTKLSVKGGKLGKKAKWIWYTSQKCTNDTKIGEGLSIIVYPKTKTTYYVRAEGSENVTNSVSFNIDIDKRSIAPNKILGKDNVCAKENINFSFENGILGSNARWVWYDNNDKQLGFDEVLNTSLTKGIQIIKVRGEGICNNTEFTTITVNVNSISNVFGINKSLDTKNKIKLSVNGELGVGAVWTWYVNSKRKASIYKVIGKGNEIKVSSKKNRTYQVIAEKGKCIGNNNDNTAFLTINEDQKERLKRKMDIVYYRENENIYKHKLFHLGAGVGAYNQMNYNYFVNNSINGFNINKNDSSSKIELLSNGLSWEVFFHPLIFENNKNQSRNSLSTSIGFFHKGGMANYNLNSTSSNLSDSIGQFKKSKFNDVSYSSLGTEVTMGLRGFRLYYSYELENNNVNFESDFLKKGNLIPEKISINQNINIEKNKFGLRFGRYASRNVLGLNKGVSYELYVMTIKSQKYDLNYKNHFPCYGAGFSMWVQSFFKLQTEVISFSNNDMYTSAKLLINLDLFY